MSNQNNGYNSEGSDYEDEPSDIPISGEYESESENELEAGSDVEEVIDKDNTYESEPESEETEVSYKDSDLEKKFEEYFEKKRKERREKEKDDEEGEDDETGDGEEKANEVKPKVGDDKVTSDKTTGEGDVKKNELPKEIIDFMKAKTGDDEDDGDDEEEDTTSNAENTDATSPGDKNPGNVIYDAPKSEQKHLYSHCTLPSGRKYWIRVPQAEKSEWSCIDKSKVITLRMDGKIGHRELRIISLEMEKTRRKHQSGSYSGYEIIKVQKIVNPCLWRRYRQARKQVKVENHGRANEKLLFHGSTAWKDLVQTGFDERYAKVGMFGAGVYFAENSSKSNQYVFGFSSGNKCPDHRERNCMICERVLLLCRVVLGKVKTYTHASPRLSHAPPGCHSVMGVPTPGVLLYSENIVFKGEQAYPEFIITYKLRP